MTHGEQEAQAVRERRRRVRYAAMFERWLFFREDRPPTDRAVDLRRDRMASAVLAISLIGYDVFCWMAPGPDPVAIAILEIVVGAIGVCYAGYAIVLTRRIKRGRGPSGFPPREAPMTDELPAEHRAKAAREDRE
jgi:hypothetical protein